MADNVIDSLTIDLNFDTRQFQESAKKVQDIISDFSNKATTTLTSIFDAFALKAGFDFAKGIADSAAKAGSQLIFMSDKLGESVETLGVWGQAAIRNGGDIKQVFTDLINLQNQITTGVHGGNPEFMQLLDSLQLTPYTDLGKIKSQTQLLFDIGDKLRNRSLYDQQWYAQQFGISNPLLRVSLHGKNREEAEKYFETLKKLGVVTRQQAELDLKLKNSQDNLDQTWEITKQRIATGLTPAFVDLNNILVKFNTEILPAIVGKFRELENLLGINEKYIIELGLGFTALTGAAAIIRGISFAVLGLNVALFPIIATLASISAGFYSVFKAYELYEEFRKDPAGFLKNPSKLVYYSLLGATVEGLAGYKNTSKRGSETNTAANTSSYKDIWQESQSSVESYRHNKPGYEVKKDINGHEYILDKNGKKIPETYVFKITPETINKYSKAQESANATNKILNTTLYNSAPEHDFKTSNLASQVAQSASARNAIPASSVTANKQNTYNIHTLNLPNVGDASTFSQSLIDATATPWTFANSVRA